MPEIFDNFETEISGGGGAGKRKGSPLASQSIHLQYKLKVIHSSKSMVKNEVYMSLSSGSYATEFECSLTDAVSSLKHLQ